MKTESPMLLTPIDEARAVALLSDNAWWMQEKKDGVRCLIVKSASPHNMALGLYSNYVTGYGRNGDERELPQAVADAAASIDGTWTIDGELCGDTFYAFDLLDVDGVDYRDKPYLERYAMLATMLGFSYSPIQRLGFQYERLNKQASFRYARENRWEGIVFKRADAPYTAGRSKDALKFKFVAAASVIVYGHGRTGKHSVRIRVRSVDGDVKLGSVTVPPSVPLPPVGSVIEVRYLYAYHGGSLCQPVYLGVRDDIGPDACTVDQLKYKQEDGE